MAIDLLKIWYCWNDDCTITSEATVALVSKDIDQSQLDTLLDRDDVFYVFTRGETILGDHGEFKVLATEVVYS